MRKNLCRVVMSLLVLLLCMSACAGEQPAETTAQNTLKQEVPSVELNVMTFNVYFNNKENLPVKNAEETANCLVSVRGPKLLSLLQGEQVDIAGLQEAGPAWRQFLLSNLQAPYTFFGHYTKSTQQGGYIVYNYEKLKLLESGHYFLAPGAPETSEKGWDGDHDRMVTWGVFKDKASGVVFLFCDTHFDHAGETARLESAKLVLQKMAQAIEKAKETYGVAQVPAFLVGDLNCSTGSEPIVQLQTALTDVRDACQGAKPDAAISSSPGLNFVESEQDYIANYHYIDHIFFSGSVTVQSVHLVHTSTNLCPYGEYISDHNAVISHVSLTN